MVKFFEWVFETALAIIIVLLNLAITGTVMSVLWDWLAPLYFDFLPAKYLTIPWFNMIVIVYFFQNVGAILFKGRGN